ncbi:conserved hypothetical protein, partial [Ricinus communis]
MLNQLPLQTKPITTIYYHCYAFTTLTVFVNSSTLFTLTSTFDTAMMIKVGGDVPHNLNQSSSSTSSFKFLKKEGSNGGDKRNINDENIYNVDDNGVDKRQTDDQNNSDGDDDDEK